MAVHTSAGSKIFIGGVATGSENLANYLAKSWVEIKNVESISAFGTTYNLVTYNDLGTRLVQKFKGSKDNGEIQLSVARNISDAGQNAFRLAVNSDSDYVFRVVENDYDGGSPLQDTNFFFAGKAMSAPVEINNADSITMSTFSIAINSEFVMQEAV